ncbi:MAG: hypothetical protein R3300_14630 [Candidatus Promineifilaceae bacterium]|nr:hypothetical protein [Candidatus Promineifilaceae bacterium]
MSIDELLDKLAAAEQDFQGKEFLAPVVGTNRVQVRIAGIICDVTITENLPADYFGYAILRAQSTREATFEREASMVEMDAYLRLFPVVRVILLDEKPSYWLTMPAHKGDERFQIQGPVVLQLPAEDLRRFETVLAAFDGRFFWFRGRDPSRNPALAAYLREQLIQEDQQGLPTAPDALHKKGLSAEERATYALVWASRAAEQQDRVELRLRSALAHAGAELRDYRERGNAYVVHYVVDGRTHVSTVRQDDLSVSTAGICLAGQDNLFDLASLVGVLRQAGASDLVWVGPDHLPEEEYRRIHPLDNH